MTDDLSKIIRALKNRQPTDPMPVFFVGHGSPMNAIQDTVFSTAWNALGPHLPRPAAILCVSAHWLTDGETRVSVTESPETIHDFSGFPYPLYEQRYPAPGAPKLARQVMDMITTRQVAADETWGLDHGAWSVLGRLFPAADIPVFPAESGLCDDAPRPLLYGPCAGAPEGKGRVDPGQRQPGA